MSKYMERQIFKCMIRILAPIHLGCDEVYEPMAFSVNEKEQKLIVFDPITFVAGLKSQDRTQFMEICRKGTISSLLEVYKFLRNRPAEGRSVSVCADFIRHYDKTLSLPMNNEKEIRQNLNRFEIPRTAFLTIDQRPYVPGSSVKGALRTGVLNSIQLNTASNNKASRKKPKQLEEDLLRYRGIPEDPFRMVKVSDFRPVGAARTRVLYAVNEEKKPSEKDARGLPLLLEVIQPDNLFEGIITVEQPFEGAGINKPLRLRDVLEGTDRFFRRESEREASELKRIDVGPAEGAPPLNGGYLIRIGRHSGAECVTVEGHRDISVRLGGGKETSMKGATTLWLASEERHPTNKGKILPFGWAELVELSQDQEARNRRSEDAWNREWKEIEAYREARLMRLNNEQERARQQEREREKEKERKRLEDGRRKAEFLAMSPEERDIALISDPGSTENQIVEIYNKIDEYGTKNRIKVAQALKEYWIRNHKWRGKTSEKQKKKIKKIKQILGQV